jgi:hemoglobin/transferrin/lactoferrin receptor protein
MRLRSFATRVASQPSKRIALRVSQPATFSMSFGELGKPMTKTMRRMLLGAACVIALQPWAAFAQETELEAISVFATAGGAISAFLFPGQVSVVERDAIDDLAATRPADIFEGVPGVTFEGGPRRSGQVPTIRGFEGEAIVILFDDARQSFSSGHDGRLFVDPDLLKAVEVVKGPTSSIYGSGAIGGVIAFRTLEAADILRDGETAAVRIKTGYQSVDDEQSYAITGVQRSESGDIDLVAHFGYRNSADIELGSGAVLPADDQMTNALVKGAFTFGDGFKSTTSWIYSNLNALDPQNPQGANVGGTDNPLVDRRVLSSTVQTKLEWKPGNNDFIDARVVAYRALNEVEEPEVELDRVTSREVETIGFKADNTSRFSLGSMAGLKLTYGTDIYRDTQTGSDSTSADGSRGGVPDAESTFIGFFSEAEFTFGQTGSGLGQLTVIPGIRWDSFESQSDLGNSIDETAVSPKIAATWSPVDWFNLFGNYGKAFRAPSYNEAYSVGNHFVIPLPGGLVANDFIINPDLQPEEAIGWEAGASFKFDGVFAAGDQFRVKGSYYEMDVDNLIELQVLTPFGALSPRCFGAPVGPPCIGGAAVDWTSQNVNVQNAELDGVEIEATYDSTFFYARATYAQINGIDADTGEYAGNLFPDRYFLDAGFKLPVIDSRIGARATFAADFTKTNPDASSGSPASDFFRDSYQVFDLYAVWQPDDGLWKGVRLDLGVDNITDEDYEVVAAGVSEEGRNYKVGLSYTIPICGTSACP